MNKVKEITANHIHVNEAGEFDKGCICGSSDFYTVDSNEKGWFEIDPVTAWKGWACITCNRIFTDDGKLIEQPTDIKWLD